MTESPNSDEEQALLAVASEAAQAVAEYVRRGFRSSLDIEFKRDSHDPVTQYDRGAEERIREVIRSHYPDATIVGEEAGREGMDELCWYVDPIDGTANFINDVAFFCTSIGVARGPRVLAAAVNDPMADNLFTATTAGAWLNLNPIKARGATKEPSAILETNYPGPRDLDMDSDVALSAFADVVHGYGTVRRLGSVALSLAHVAAGWVDGTFGSGVNPWDVCAGSLLVRAAGGAYHGYQPDGTTRSGDFRTSVFAGHVAELDATLLQRGVAAAVRTHKA